MGTNRLPLTIVLGLFIWLISPAQDFTWKKGHTQTGQKGYYGIMGVASPSNIPGARGGATYWQDASGGFWMFGGDGKDYVGNDGLLNDLWLYDLATNNWTWVKGDDFIAQLGHYGTKGVAATGNRPGCRTGAVSWVDGNGKFWIFGGYGYDSQASMGYLNDLWKFDPATNNWTWVNGSDLVNQSGTYGTQGTTSPTVHPGARVSATAWRANNGNFYLFGGMGYNDQTTVGSLNDVWIYNVSANAWTWVSGSNNIDQAGTYGSPGVPASSNIPGSRKSAISWKDKTGDFWLMGGFGKDANATTSGFLNDLWKYDVTLNQWTWIKGQSLNSAPGSYGTLGVTVPANEPGARAEGTTWVDVQNTLWLLGGEGFTGSSSGKLNDLWRYDIISNQWTWVKSSSIINQPGSYGSMGVANTNNRPGGRNQTCSWIDSKNNLYLFGGHGYGTNTTPSGPLNDLWKYTNCFIDPITMTITAQDSVLCAGESTSLTVVGSDNYLWLNNLSTASYIVIKPSGTITYTVLSSNNNGCLYSTMFTHTVSACENIQTVSQKKITPVIYPNPNNGTFKLITTENASRLRILNALGQVVYEKQINSSSTEFNSTLKAGVYFYQVHFKDEKTRSGKLVVE